MKKYIILTTLITFAILSSPSHAQLGIPKLGGSASGAKSNSNAPDVNAFVLNYLTSRQQVLQANSHFWLALGNKTEADKLKVAAESIKSGGVDASNLKKVTELSQSAQADIDAKLASAPTLDATGKAEYVKGLDSLIGGLITARQVAMSAGEVSSSLGSNPMNLAGSGRVALGVAKDAPAYVSNLQKAVTGALEFGKRNGVKPTLDPTAALKGE